MVYGRLITFKRNAGFAILLAGCLLLSSCTENIIEAKSSGSRVDALNTNFYYNGKGLIYERNPIVASGKSGLSYPVMKDYVSSKFVTDNSNLSTKCSLDLGFFITTQENCFQVLNDTSSSTPLLAKNGGWGYGVDTDEFYQVNTFYHANKMLKRFYEGLATAHNIVHYPMLNNRNPPATKFEFQDTLSFWFTKALRDPNDPSVTLDIETPTLNIFSKCYIRPFNAYFSPSENKLCLGWNEQISFLRAAQDPSVIYHELGHALVKVMMNQRNTLYDSSRPPFFSPYHKTSYQSELGALFYDEAGAINEGIADWFSYFINGRKHFAEWAFGRFHKASRPMSEDDPLHKGLVSKSSGERLSYPGFLHFDPNNPEEKHEDIHYAGQIVSHYLVSLTEEFKNSCGLNQHEHAANLVLMLLNETLAELGDMTGKGSDIFDEFMKGPGNEPDEGAFFTNLNYSESYLWAHQVNPPNFRKFFQSFAKNIKHHIIDKNLCSFSEDESELLLDEYGLLLFSSYGDHKKGVELPSGSIVAYDTYVKDNTFHPSATYTPRASSSSVNEINRRNSALVSKDFLEYPENREGVSPAYIVDDRASIEGLLASLTFEGKNVQTSEGVAGVVYNNNNIKISPGEIVGIALNLFNSSNSMIGGAQVLANDWDHMKLDDPNKTHVNRAENFAEDLASWSPCQVNGWPTVNENGKTDSDDRAAGNCAHVTKDNFSIDSSTANPTYAQDSPQPICMVQYSADDETQWVSQDFYRKHALGLEDHECLNSPSYSDKNFNPNECMIRFLPGADQMVLGKIDPQKSWAQTLAGTTSEGLEINSVNVMEVNKWIPPGTTFNCRFRARFTNCSDCFENPDTGEEYMDHEFAGAKPFKVINFKFTVID